MIVRDLFTGTDGNHWELGRLMSAGSFASYTGAFLFALAKGHIPDWSGLGMGYAAVLAGSGALIGLKDMAKTNADAKAP